MGDKLLKNIRDRKNNVRIEELVKLIEAYRFTWKKTKHGYLFQHEKLVNVTMPHVPIPHGREMKVLRRYVELCLQAIEDLQRREKP